MQIKGKYIKKEFVFSNSKKKSIYIIILTINEILVGTLFLIGSILFFKEQTTYLGTWLFVIGSILLLIKPIIMLIRDMHLYEEGKYEKIK